MSMGDSWVLVLPDQMIHMLLLNLMDAFAHLLPSGDLRTKASKPRQRSMPG